MLTLAPRPTLEKCYLDVEPKQEASARQGSNSPPANQVTTLTTIQHRFAAKKTSFMQAKFARKFNKSDL
jgi:hypothetical protein